MQRMQWLLAIVIGRVVNTPRKFDIHRVACRAGHRGDDEKRAYHCRSTHSLYLNSMTEGYLKLHNVTIIKNLLENTKLISGTNLTVLSLFLMHD